MAVHITYDGVPSSRGGNIFSGMKIWVAQRIWPAVPSFRSSLIKGIKTNGGTVEPLEKNADILIADGTRKDVPLGSYHFEYITDSIKNGALQIADRYLNKAAAPQKSSSSRNAFTTQDDVLLCKWVVSHQGNHQGQRLYKDLEKLHPRHTWQSWRNRYVKVLSQTGSDNILRLANEDPPAEVKTPATATPSRVPPKMGQEPCVSPRRAEPRQPATPKVFPERETVATTPPPSMAAPNQPAVTESVVRELASSPRITEPQDDKRAEMSEFYEDLDTYCNFKEMTVEKERHIGDKIVGLWELKITIDLQDVPFDQIDWPLVAEDLGFSPDEREQIEDDLSTYFQENLRDFLEASQSVGQGEGDDGGELKQDSEGKEEEQSQRVEQRALSEHIRSSPPLDTGNKRSLDTDSSCAGQSAKRRRRLSPNAEIPSTPDERVGLTKQPRFFQTQSPSVRRNLAAGIEQDCRVGSAARTRSLSRHQSEERRMARSKHDEANEEQTLPPPRLETQQSQYEVTPSQQLKSEAYDVSPVPLRFSPRITPEPRRAQSARKPDAAKTIPAPQARTKASRRSLPASFPTASRAPPRPRKDGAERQQQQQRPLNQRRNSNGDRPWAGSNDSQTRIAACVEYYESLGYPNDIVVDALKRTTLTPGDLAALVMQSLQDGRGVPTHHEGVWTDRDDEGLLMVDRLDTKGLPVDSKEVRRAKKEFERLTRKHGLDGIETRRQFLEAQAASQ